VLLVGFWKLRSSVEYLGRYMIAGACAAGLALLLLQVYHAVDNGSVIGTGLQVAGRDATLTGRTELWEDLWTIASEHPIVGVGYGAFWIENTHNLWARHLWKPNQGHNGYLDVYLELGGVGVALLLSVVVAGYVRVFGLLRRNYDLGVLHFLWITMVVVHNFTESSYLRGTVDMWFMFLLGVINIPEGSVLTGVALSPAKTPALASARAWSKGPRQREAYR
jgi:exopolysaccharide production protein ExoQ